MAELGRTIGGAAAEAAARAKPPAEYSPDADSAGRRALAHAAWALQVAGGSIGGAELISLYRQAANLTDRLAALRLLVHHEIEGAEDALAAFAERYRDNALVLDKWFAVQATAPAHAALDRVKALAGHPAFSLKNPNRVYALIRSFAAGNPVGFNRPDGAGYRYVAEIVGRLDAGNPSVAARLATAFRSWRMLEPARRRLAEAALTELRGAERLSRDLSDIVARTLEA
jgi:aminopeptidase N